MYAEMTTTIFHISIYSITAPTVQFDQHYYTVREGEGSVAVCVQISLNSVNDILECDVVAILSTIDGVKAGTCSVDTCTMEVVLSLHLS